MLANLSMERVLIYKNKISKTYYDAEKSIIYYEFAGIIDRKATEIHLNAVLDFVKDKKVKGILTDISKLIGSFSKLLPFLKDVYYPLMIERGLYCKATVVSNDIITSHLSERLQEVLIKIGIKSNIFNNVPDAEEWMSKVLAEKRSLINKHSK